MEFSEPRLNPVVIDDQSAVCYFVWHLTIDSIHILNVLDRDLEAATGIHNVRFLLAKERIDAKDPGRIRDPEVEDPEKENEGRDHY
jgi:hypothetical protein